MVVDIECAHSISGLGCGSTDQVRLPSAHQLSVALTAIYIRGFPHGILLYLYLFLQLPVYFQCLLAGIR